MPTLDIGFIHYSHLGEHVDRAAGQLIAGVGKRNMREAGYLAGLAALYDRSEIDARPWPQRR